MEHLKHFFKQKGLYLACLAVVFAATAAGVLALRSVLNHVVELTGTAQEETPWPVSYTHLDVYKRQGRSSALPLCVRWP